MDRPTEDYILTLLHKGTEMAQAGQRDGARTCFNKVLEHEPYNETALLWLAHLADGPQEAYALLEGVVARNPHNELAQTYLDMARRQLENRAAPPPPARTATGTLITPTPAEEYRNVPMSNRTIPFLGEYLLQKKAITQQQLNTVLRLHYDLGLQGKHKRVGEILVELGYLSQAELDQWIRQQENEVSRMYQDSFSD